MSVLKPLRFWQVHEMRMRAVWSGIFLAILGFTVPVDCAMGGRTLYYIGPVSESEFDALPSYCKKLASNSAAEYPSITYTADEEGVIRGISGLHHYCRIPVLRMRQARETDTYKKGYFLTLIVDEADYVTSHSKPDAPLVGAAFQEKARVLVERQQYAPAITEYLRALQINPKASSVYMDLARLYERLNNKVKALEFVTEGLRQNPNKSLRKRYLELGGKEPFPTPYPDKNVSTSGAATDGSSAKPSRTPTPTPALAPIPQEILPQVSPPPVATPTEANKAQPKADSDKSQSTDKRFCRFCPEP